MNPLNPIRLFVPWTRAGPVSLPPKMVPRRCLGRILRVELCRMQIRLTDMSKACGVLLGTGSQDI